jgi:diguanylate cyclase (GGDEF)-like protein/putative nucleotidyltransferase with HDIG domain
VRWSQQSRACRLYIWLVYLAALPFAVACLTSPNDYSFEWASLALTSVFVATINVRLPKLSVVISMGDVFIILILIQFGPGPALITYWASIVVAHAADLFRRYGWNLKGRIAGFKWIFNLACCALSTSAMFATYRAVSALNLRQPLHTVTALFGIAIAWFFVNTGTISLAVSFWTNRTFLTVWREGIVLYLLNFMGSAAAAGLMRALYERTGFLIFLLCIPLAVLLYQLYDFYIQKYEQAQSHIKALNTLYLQTVEALASAVDAKDRYTHGHIRRVQAYATELARLIGIQDEKELLALQAGALLHDIGKIAIPEYILNKPTVLTETEYEKMKIHPVVGAQMLSTIEFPFPLMPMVKWHHERWDGKGYPDGLAAEEIPLSARILSLVDCYDALTTNRPYRAPMDRDKVIEFFRREAGRSYDPAIVQTFIENIQQLETAGSAVVIENLDLWGIKESEAPSSGVRPLEKIQPIVSYSKALNAEAFVQRELYSVFEFAQADFHCLTPVEVFSFMGRRLLNLIKFDTAVFFDADLTKGTVVAAHAIGDKEQFFEGLSLPLEQKLTGWVAANNQSLCNLPPFPDFLNFAEPKPAFQISAIAPINRQNEVLGAISLYRNEAVKFTEEEFRRLEIVASQTAILLKKCKESNSRVDSLTDDLTGLPKSFQLYLMFDSVAVDASRYEYPLALLSIQLEDIANIRKKWGHLSGDEAIRATANYLRKELRDTDLLVRYGADEFIAVNPKMSRVQAENLKSRVQNELDQFNFAVRAHTEIPLRASIGIAVFPEDGTDLESLLSVSELRARDDRDLRLAVNRRIKRLPASS